MIRDLAALSDRFRPYADRLLASAAVEGIPVTVIETLRSKAQQEINIARGVSWTRHSLHLTGDAIDICPTAYLAIKGWFPDGPLWERLGQLGEFIGLTWGGRWKDGTGRPRPDCPHFQYKKPIVSSQV
jgi:peptidoglycan L-alanyl-D-glutamate endopeptidase CwlK